MFEFLFWFLLAGLIIASFQDFKRREVDYWLNYLLIAGSAGFILFYAIFNSDYLILLQGIFAFAIFLLLGNLFYYARIYGGGDAWVLIALSSFFIGSGFIQTLQNQGIFILLSFFIGSIWGLIFAFFVFFKNFSKCTKHLKEQVRKGYFKLGFLIGIVFLIFSYINIIFLSFSILIFLAIFLWAFSKSVENSSMTKFMHVSEVRQGDYLAKEIRFKGKVIKADWEGISLKDLNFLKSKKFKGKISVRDGVPYVPSFLITLIIYWLFKSEIFSFLANLF